MDGHPRLSMGIDLIGAGHFGRNIIKFTACEVGVLLHTTARTVTFFNSTGV